ncbi:hypothetical protein Tco_1334659 [Tanacetum coccineum]
MRHGFDLGYKTWVHHGEPDLPPPPPVIDNTRQPQMSDMTALLNDLSYIPPNNEHNEPTQGDIGETSNEPNQATRNEFEKLYDNANEELHPRCDYVTRLDFMAKFTYFKVKGQKFNMRAMVLWTINDFPARSSLSGWSGQAYVGHRRFLKKPHKWRSSREFNGQTDNRDPPKEFGQDEILAQLDRLPTRLTEDDMLKAQIKVVDILCDLEAHNILLLSCIMIHLGNSIYLTSALEGGPIRHTSLFGFVPKVEESEMVCTIQHSCDRHVPSPFKSRDERRTTQNSGICSPGGNDGEMYYGQLQEILEFSYLSFKVVLFRVKWFDTRNEGRKVQRLVLRNNMTQILTKDEAFKDDQYILATQVKQCFYLEDMARRPPHWKVVEHVNHKKFSDGGVIVVEEDPDVIHFDNSSDLPLSTSLNDLNNATLHIDGQSTEVDAPPDIIDLDEDDDIIDDEDALPHDLADSDDEDLVNVEDDDGVEVMSADVAWSHDGDCGGEDRPPPHHVPSRCMGCFANRGKGKRSPNLGGRAAGRLNTRDKTQYLSLKEITDKKGPVPICFELRDKQTLMPLGDHAAHWSSYIGEVIRGVPLYYPSWLKVPKERKAALITDIGAQHWVIDPRNIARAAQNRQNRAKSTVISRQGSRSLARLRDEMRQSSATQEYPSLIDTFFVAHTVNGEFLQDEDRRIYEEMRRLEATGTYTDDEINRLARRGKQRGYISSVGRVLLARATAGPISVGWCQREYGLRDDEESADDQEDEDEDEDGDGDS